MSQKHRVNISGMNWMNSRVEKYSPKNCYPGLLPRAWCKQLPKEASVPLSQDATQQRIKGQSTEEVIISERESPGNNEEETEEAVVTLGH